MGKEFDRFNVISKNLPTLSEVVEDIAKRNEWPLRDIPMSEPVNACSECGRVIHSTTMTVCVDCFGESDWLRAAKKALAARDPLDALRDSEELTKWAHARWGDTLSHANLNEWLRKHK